MIRFLLAQADQLRATGKVLGFCFLVAAIAGFMRAAAKKLSLRETIVAAGVSGVGGLVVGAVCLHLWGPDRWYLTCAGCGLAGWLGGNVILDWLVAVGWSIVKAKLPGATNPPGKEADHGPSSPFYVDAPDSDRAGRS